MESTYNQNFIKELIKDRYFTAEVYSDFEKSSSLNDFNLFINFKFSGERYSVDILNDDNLFLLLDRVKKFIIETPNKEQIAFYTFFKQQLIYLLFNRGNKLSLLLE